MKPSNTAPVRVYTDTDTAEKFNDSSDMQRLRPCFSHGPHIASSDQGNVARVTVVSDNSSRRYGHVRSGDNWPRFGPHRDLDVDDMTCQRESISFLGSLSTDLPSISRGSDEQTFLGPRSKSQV